MKAIERRLSKLEMKATGSQRSLQSLSDEELDMYIGAILKRAHGSELDAEERRLLDIRLPPSPDVARMSNDDLRAGVSVGLFNWLRSDGQRAIEIVQMAARTVSSLARQEG